MKQPNWIADNQIEITLWYIRHALTSDAMAQGAGEYFIPRRMRWFYRLKAIVCLILNREPDFSRNPYAHLDGVTIAYTNGGEYSSPDGQIYWGEMLNVGYGLFSNWWQYVYQDSN